MTLAEALRIILDLAADNMICNDPGSPELKAEYDRQVEAHRMVEELCEDHEVAERDKLQ